MKKTLFVLSAIAILTSCSENDQSSQEKQLLDSIPVNMQSVSISRDILDEMMRTLPSPIETANMITQSKTEFNKDLLIPSENADKFADKYSQALALGGYGVDLGYLNLNNKTLYVISYLEGINTISKDLKVSQLLDFSLLNNLAKNRNNVDSLIRISTENFNEIDEHLRSQNRGDLSVLILIGSWIEGLHMFNNIAKKDPSEDIIKRIGEQKVIIDNMYAILDKLEGIDYYKNLKNELQGLKKTFEKVKISYTYKEPTMQEVNGELIVVDNTETNVMISKDVLSQIDQEISSFRNRVFLTNNTVQ
jgi:hypothetical protein